MEGIVVIALSLFVGGLLIGGYVVNVYFTQARKKSKQIIFTRREEDLNLILHIKAKYKKVAVIKLEEEEDEETSYLNLLNKFMKALDVDVDVIILVHPFDSPEIVELLEESVESRKYDYYKFFDLAPKKTVEIEYVTV